MKSIKKENKDKQILISVILPIYNAESYLNRCLDNLINQTYTNLEIICVDDGSTDNSLKLLKEYQDKDNRIKVIHQNNAGPGITRNIGLSVATGDYISFIDADDYSDKEMFNLMLQKQIDYDADICCCNVAWVYKDKQENCIPVIKDGLISNDLAMKFIGNDSFNSCLWNKLFKKELLENFKLIEKLCSEDYDACVRLIAKAKKIYYMGNVLYFYFKENPDSITINCLKEKTTRDTFYVNKKCLYYLEKQHFLSALPMARKKVFIASVLLIISIYIYDKEQHNRISLLKIKSVLKKNFKYLLSSNIGFDKKLFCIIFSYLPFCFKYIKPLLKRKYLKTYPS